MRWLAALVFCSIAAVLPWRLRHAFVRCLAFWSQAMYFLYYSVIKILMKNLGGEEQRHE